MTLQSVNSSPSNLGDHEKQDASGSLLVFASETLQITSLPQHYVFPPLPFEPQICPKIHPETTPQTKHQKHIQKRGGGGLIAKIYKNLGFSYVLFVFFSYLRFLVSGEVSGCVFGARGVRLHFFEVFWVSVVLGRLHLHNIQLALTALLGGL